MKRACLSLLVSALALVGVTACGERPQPHTPASPGAADFDGQTFEASVGRLRTETGARAVLAGLWVGDEAVKRIALGDSMTGVPADTDMTVRIGGISQLFLGTLLMRLVEQGRLSLDDKVSKYLPDLFAADKVTVGMLARNTAGYKDYVHDPTFVDLMLADPFKQFTSQEIMDLGVKDGELAFTPGTQQKYSHTEFTILCEVMERATGRSMADLFHAEIFGPLGLTRTGYSSSPTLPDPVLHVFSSERGVYEDATFWNPSWAGGSGILYSSLDDLGTWGPVFGKGRLLRESSFRELTRRPDAALRSDLYFATGFVVANGWFLQNPMINGYTGTMGYLSDLDLTLVVFASQPPTPKVEHPAFEIFKKLVLELAPSHPINF